jgi:hypothetical protein
LAKARGRFRNQRGLVDKTIAPDEEPVWEPDRGGAIPEENYPIVFDRESGVATPFILRVRREARPESGRLAYFAVVATDIDGERRMVAIDPSHGELHAHLYDREGEEVGKVVLMSSIDGQGSMDKAYDLAQAALFEDERLRKHLEEW